MSDHYDGEYVKDDGCDINACLPALIIGIIRLVSISILIGGLISTVACTPTTDPAYQPNDGYPCFQDNSQPGCNADEITQDAIQDGLEMTGKVLEPAWDTYNQAADAIHDDKYQWMPTWIIK